MKNVVSGWRFTRANIRDMAAPALIFSHNQTDLNRLAAIEGPLVSAWAVFWYVP